MDRGINMIYFKNKKSLDTFLMVFILGAVKAYRRNYIDLTILEYYIFSMLIRLMKFEFKNVEELS